MLKYLLPVSTVVGIHLLATCTKIKLFKLYSDISVFNSTQINDLSTLNFTMCEVGNVFLYVTTSHKVTFSVHVVIVVLSDHYFVTLSQLVQYAYITL